MARSGSLPRHLESKVYVAFHGCLNPTLVCLLLLSHCVSPHTHASLATLDYFFCLIYQALSHLKAFVLTALTAPAAPGCYLLFSCYLFPGTPPIRLLCFHRSTSQFYLNSLYLLAYFMCSHCCVSCVSAWCGIFVKCSLITIINFNWMNE